MTSSVANGNPWAGLGVSDFVAGLVAKLPPGDAYLGVALAGLLGGVAQPFADVQAAASQLSEVETLPGTTDVLLPYWEFDYGLPDCCTPLGATIQQRRGALLAKIASVGGASEAYFIMVAAALGYTITITEGATGSHTWTINAAAVAPVTLFRVGASRAGDRLESFGTNAQLECVMNRIKPAHTKLIFSYT